MKTTPAQSADLPGHVFHGRVVGPHAEGGVIGRGAAPAVFQRQNAGDGLASPGESDALATLQGF
jgi:hypothetical protein